MDDPQFLRAAGKAIGIFMTFTDPWATLPRSFKFSAPFSGAFFHLAFSVGFFYRAEVQMRQLGEA
jgi:hypothetical protein